MIGGDGIEGLLISPKQLPFKYIEVCVFDAYITRIYDYSAKNAMLTMARTHTLTQANVYLCVFVFGPTVFVRMTYSSFLTFSSFP